MVWLLAAAGVVVGFLVGALLTTLALARVAAKADEDEVRQAGELVGLAREVQEIREELDLRRRA